MAVVGAKVAASAAWGFGGLEGFGAIGGFGVNCLEKLGINSSVQI